MQEKEPQYVNSIIRATAILELYEKLNVQYLGIAEISKELGIQKTTVFNIVKTLVHQGWLIQDNPNGKYRLGTRILRVSTMITQSITTEELIEKEMRCLRDEYNEDVVLTAMVDGVPICVEKVKSANYLQIQSRLCKRFHRKDIVCMAAGGIYSRDVEKDISGDGRRIAGERAGRGTIKKDPGAGILYQYLRAG